MPRNFWRILATAVALSALLLLAGCGDDDEDNNNNLPSSLTITSPDNGDTWIVGSVHTITWTEQNVDAVDIGYSTNGGTSWIGIAQNVTSASYLWTIPNTPSATCQLGMRNHADTTVSDMSGTFTIALPALVATWIAPYAATYDSLGIDSMRLVFTLDSAYTMMQWAGSTEITEDGDYAAFGDSIRFDVANIDGLPVDTSYTHWYDLPTATTLQVEVMAERLYRIVFNKR